MRRGPKSIFPGRSLTKREAYWRAEAKCPGINARRCAAYRARRDAKRKSLTQSEASRRLVALQLEASDGS